MIKSNVYPRKVAVIGLLAIAALGGTVAAVTSACADSTHANVVHGQHRVLPNGYHYRNIKNPDCGKDQRAIIAWADKGDSSVMICRNGSKVETS